MLISSIHVYHNTLFLQDHEVHHKPSTLMRNDMMMFICFILNYLDAKLKLVVDSYQQFVIM